MGVDEFQKNRHGGWAPGKTIDIKLPGNPAVQLGIAVTAQDITDVTAAYTLSDQDVYNVTRAINIQDIGVDVVGGKLAFTSNPFEDPKNSKRLSPQARTFIDQYAFPAGQSIKSKVEKTITRKLKNATWYTPIDTPAKLGNVNSYDTIAGAQTLMDELGFQEEFRYAYMNPRDYQSVSSSLQNMFNQEINEPITTQGRYRKRELAGFEFMKANTIENTAEAPQFSVSPTFTVASVAADGSTITFAGVQAVTSVIFNAGSLISIPSVNLFNKVNEVTLETKLVVDVAVDATGDGAGNVVVTLSDPLIAVGEQANVNALPAGSAPAELFPAHRNNYFCIPMGYLANPLPLGDIASADMNTHRKENMYITTYVQGLVLSGVNTFRMSFQCPTLAIPRYLINLPSAI